jgi:hypothetical protein
MSCLSACSPTITPMVLATCTPQTKPGGIRAIGVMLCDADFDDVSGGAITDPSTWQTLIEEGKIFVSGHVVGSKAQGSDTNLRIASCLPEVKVGSTKTITIRDYNADPENLTEYDFYKSIEDNYATLKFFYVTCDELVYFYENGVWAAGVDDVRGETKEEPVHIAITVNVSEIGMKKPVKVEGILEVITTASNPS